MKKAILFLFFFVTLVSAAVGQNANDWFVTVWDMSKPTERTINNPSNTIAFPGAGRNYTLYWEDVDNPSINGTEIVLSSEGYFSPYYLTVPSSIGKYRLKAYKGAGSFYGFGGETHIKKHDPQRLIAVEQWGTVRWFETGLKRAFFRCTNMDVTATDSPDLRLPYLDSRPVQDLTSMFFGCTSLVNANGSIGNWNTQNVIDMGGMFCEATQFNQPLNWNTQNVTNMNSMFYGATLFNQPLNWNTSNVTSMAYMFSGATSFNQPLYWDTEKVRDMRYMFKGATSFNGFISNWETKDLNNTSHMFEGATSFNQPIGNWNLARDTSMAYMFSGATSFNQPLNWRTSIVGDMSYMFNGAVSFNSPFSPLWYTGKVTNMSYMFAGATSFNQPIGNWNTSKVHYMEGVFKGAVSFNQPLYRWSTTWTYNMKSMFENATSFNQTLYISLHAMSEMENILKGCGMDCRNLSAILVSFNRQLSSLYGLIDIGSLDANQYYNYAAKAAIDAMRSRGWIINGGTFGGGSIDCPEESAWFKTRWIAPASGTIKFPATSSGYGLMYEPIDANTGRPIGSSIKINPASAGQVISGLTPGWTYRIYAVGPTFKQINFGDYPDNKDDIISVEQWGEAYWTSFERAFYECLNVDVIATDRPTLAYCPSLDRMFFGCTSLVNANSSMSNWYTPHVKIMSGMFAGATQFNKPLNWDVTNVETMAWMFSGATSFNQPINFDIRNVLDLGHMFVGASAFNSSVTFSNTSKVTNMESMFRDAVAFDQPIGDWNTSQVIDMKRMFEGARVFNQDISSWNTEKVKNMGGMFNGAYKFNQPIGSWNTQSLESTYAMFWEATDFNKPLTWNTPNLNNTYGMFGGATSFNSSLTFSSTENVTNMSNMFRNATSFNQPLTFNTRNVADMSYMFYGATVFDQNLSGLRIDAVTDMTDMLKDCGIACPNLSSTLDSWNTKAAALSKNNINLGNLNAEQYYDNTGLTAINALRARGWTITGGTLALVCIDNVDWFKTRWIIPASGTIKFPATGSGYTIRYVPINHITGAPIGAMQIINSAVAGQVVSGLNVGWMYRIDAYGGTFSQLSFNDYPDNKDDIAAIEQWGAIAWSSFEKAFYECRNMDLIAIDKPNLTSCVSLDRMFFGCTSLVNVNSSISSWETDNIVVLGGMFAGAIQFNKPLNWNTVNVKNTSWMFSGAIAFNQPINFDTRNLLDMGHMFVGAIAFNSPFGSNWNTEKVTNMESMFRDAVAFNQSIGNWNTSQVIDMKRMFEGARVFNQDISSWNTEKVKNMGGMFNGAYKFNQPIGSWNTQSLESTYAMFWEAIDFNKPLTWNTPNLNTTYGMFGGATSFNSTLTFSTTANVTDMSSMFQNARVFNKDISSWNVEKVTTMENMFHNAEAFDQDLSGWTLKSVTNALNMFSAPLNKGMSCGNYSETLQGWAINSLTKTGLSFGGQDNRQYNIIGKEARDILTKPIADGGKGWTISGDTYDKNCGIDYVWTGAVSTDITDHANWRGGLRAESSPILGELRATVAFDSLAVRDMYIPSLPYTPPGSDPNVIHFYSFGNLINNSNKKVVIEPNGHLHINKWVLGSSTPADVDKIVIKADDTRPNGSLILAGQPCDNPVYATVEMYSKASKSAVSISWTDNIPGSPTFGQSISSSYKWQYIGIPVEGEVVNAFYGSYLRKYDETLNSTDHFYGKWRKLGADETWQPLVPFAGYEVTSRTPKVYVFKGRLLHCPQELTLTRRAAEVTAYTGTDIHKKYYGLGQNIFGNSYTAALRIGDGRLSDAIGSKPIEKTVYIYNTGSIADWNGGSTLTGDGSFLAVPANITGSPELSAEYISSMQGFLLKFRNDALTDNTGAPEKITIGLRGSGLEPFGGNQRPQRAPQADPIHGFLKVGLTSRRSVSSISLIEAEGTTDEFDNGWDGMQLNTGRSSSATLFVPSEYGDLQVSTSDNIVGDRFGIVNNGDTTYRLTVIRHRLDNRGDLYLYDVATNRYTLLDADTTVYDFTSEGSGNVDKRFAITDRRNADDPNTAVEEAADDMSLYGYVDGRHTLVVNNHTAEAGMLTLLDISGKVVYTSPFRVGFSRHDLSHLPAGVYIARLEASTRRATVKAITMK